MKKMFNFLASKIYFALICLPTTEPEKYEIKDIENIALCYSKVFFETTIPVAVLVITWGAFQLLTAYGNEEKAQRGKTIIVWGIWGLVVAFLAWVIVAELWRILALGEEIPSNIPIDKWP